MAFTLDEHGSVTITDLGDAGEIDSLVGLARKRIYEANAEVGSARAEESERRLSEVTAKLYGTIFAPLEAKLDDNADIYVSPDGALNLLPLEILSCPDGEYVIEKYRVTYLSSGRDLLRFEEKPPSGDRALIMASPDFDSYIQEVPEPKDTAPQVHNPYAFIPEPARSVSECLDALFTRLLHSLEEAESISGILKQRAHVRVDDYLDAHAREEVLKTMESAPWILHLATHGFFCPAPDITGSVLENPLLRCGLAFAGANLVITGNYRLDANQEDGFFSALEASALNLVGTELVVLSSCETGVGEIKNSEGVYGLRRAFQHAGARTIIMSLWKVQDKETRELMEAFYNNWMSGDTKKEALRKAALKILNDHRAKGESTHPLLWGGFVLLGDPN
jgi:CHAT domain-containing protein